MIEKVQDRLQDVYGTNVAPVSNEQRRIHALPGDSAVQLPGTLTSPASTRVAQYPVSTPIVHGILVAMSTCALVSNFMIKARYLLPRSPCSIAAVAVLLAKSSILSENMISPGSEFHYDRRLQTKGVLDH